MSTPICGNRILPENANDLAKQLPAIPVDDEGPVFAEPWQAQAFAMTVKLHEKGAFTWLEWAEALSRELKAAGENDSVDNYYQHWLTAFENLLNQKNIVEKGEREACKSAWDKAARATPHGTPIVLGG